MTNEEAIAFLKTLPPKDVFRISIEDEDFRIEGVYPEIQNWDVGGKPISYLKAKLDGTMELYDDWFDDDEDEE